MGKRKCIQEPCKRAHEASGFLGNMKHTNQRLYNALGIVSVLISMSFWLAYLPGSVPGVRLLNAVSIPTYMILWIIAVVLALLPLASVSRWWIIAVLLPFANALFVIAIALLGEWMASRPG